jgi:hypothetical protein
MGVNENLEIRIGRPYDYLIEQKNFKETVEIVKGKYNVLCDEYVPDLIWYKSNKIHYLVYQISKDFSFINSIEYILLA